MITEGYINNILDKSNHQATILFDKKCILATELPNSKILVSGLHDSFELCKDDIRKQLKTLEEYIDLDKKKYNYDLSEEFYDEGGEE